jgi:hypothetical protein
LHVLQVTSFIHYRKEFLEHATGTFQPFNLKNAPLKGPKE